MALADPENGYTNLAKIKDFSVTLVKPCWCPAVIKLPSLAVIQSTSPTGHDSQIG